METAEIFQEIKSLIQDYRTTILDYKAAIIASNERMRQSEELYQKFLEEEKKRIESEKVRSEKEQIIREKEWEKREKKREQKEQERERLKEQKEAEREKLKEQKEAEREKKREQKEQERERLKEQKEAEREKLKEQKEAEREKKREQKEQERENKWRQREIEQDKKAKSEMAALRKQMRETDIKIKQLATKYSSQIGHVVEGLMEPSALKLFKKFGFHIVKCWKEMKGTNAEQTKGMEVDLFLHDTTDAVAVEVKTNCKNEDVDYFLSQMEKFNEVFPEYAHVNVYVAMAAINYNRGAAEYAASKGLFVIRVNDDSFSLDPAKKSRMTYFENGNRHPLGKVQK